VVKNKSMEKKSYDIEWKVEGLHWWFVTRRKLLKSILLSFNFSLIKGIVVDIGCGGGSNLRLLRSLGISAIGLDKSIFTLSFTKKRLKYSSESIGLIIALNIIENLENHVNGIHEFYQP
jgi:2-polyprenyl-3-methyl-5-hydroxy-6-metoxy-1,4-benzoquinol methylase